jgi:hypothetical protein
MVSQELYSRVILWLNPTLAVHFVLDSLSVESLLDLFHSSQVQDSTVGHDHDLLGSHILKVHADFLGAAWAEANTRRGHLEGILFLLGVVDWCCKSTSSL